MEDVDRPGVRIVVKARAAYDLWLTENIQHATIVRTKTIDESFSDFCDQGISNIQHAYLIAKIWIITCICFHVCLQTIIM